MQSRDNELRTKVLIEVNEDFHQADKVNDALKTEILVEIIKACKERDNTIRTLASSALTSVANTSLGREIIVSNNILPHIAALFEDQVTMIRYNAYSCLINFAEFTFGIQAIIDTDILRILVDKLVIEREDAILILI